MLATALRIYRIVKVYDKYMMYLDTQKMELSKPRSISQTGPPPSMGDSDSVPESTKDLGDALIANHEKKYNDSISSSQYMSDLQYGDQNALREMSDLKESRILIKGILCYFVPVVILGGLAMFLPIFYSIFPV